MIKKCPTCKENSSSYCSGCSQCVGCDPICDDCNKCGGCAPNCDDCNDCECRCSCQSKDQKMTTAERAKKALKKDVESASYRIAAKQIPKGLRKPLTAFLKKKGADSNFIKGMDSFLQTDLGLSVLSLILGSALEAIPGVQENTKVSRLAHELRVEAMATAGDQGLDYIMEFVGPLVKDVFKVINSQPGLLGTSEKLKLPAGISNQIKVKEAVNARNDD